MMKEKNFKCELISWNKFWRLSRNLSFKVKESGFKPDVIVAIGRGGWIPARVLSDFLNIFNLASIKIEHYYKGARMQKEAIIKHPLNVDIKGMNVLVVDDVSDTGDTLMLAYDHIKAFSPSKVKFAVLQHKQVSSFIPHYYATKIVKWRWIIYPWAIVEDVSDFVEVMKDRPGTVEGIRKRLEQDFGLKIRMSVLSDVLKASEVFI